MSQAPYPVVVELNDDDEYVFRPTPESGRGDFNINEAEQAVLRHIFEKGSLWHVMQSVDWLGVPHSGDLYDAAEAAGVRVSEANAEEVAEAVLEDFERHADTYGVPEQYRGVHRVDTSSSPEQGTRNESK